MVACIPSAIILISSCQAETHMEHWTLIREYEIFHKEDPENKVKFRTPRTMTVKQIKEKIVAAGFFSETIIKELRVDKISK